MRLVVLLSLLASPTAWASAGSSGVLVETTGGSPSLASNIETRLAEDGGRVVGAAEVRAAVRFLGIATPVDDAGATQLQKAVGVDSLVIVSSKPAFGSSAYVMTRMVTANGLSRRFDTATPETFDTVAMELFEQVRAAPPAPVQVAAATPVRVPVLNPMGTPFIWRPAPEPQKGGFGKKRAFEVGAEVFFWTGASRERLQGQESRVQYTDTILNPVYGVFVADRLELLLSFAYRSSYRAYTGASKEKSSSLALSPGVAYLFPLNDSFHVGPHAGVGWVARKTTYEQAGYYPLDVVEDGTVLTGGIVAKTAIGSSALFIVDVRYFHEALGIEYSSAGASANGRGDQSGLELTVGFSFWHRRDR